MRDTDIYLVKAFLEENIGGFEDFLAMNDIDPVEAESIIEDLGNERPTNN